MSDPGKHMACQRKRQSSSPASLPDMENEHHTAARLAILDIDGTLTDTVALHQAALEDAMRSFSFPALDTDWAGYRHHTDSGIFAEAWERAGWGSPAEADRRRLEDRFNQAFAALLPSHPIREIPGAAAFVELLRREGWRVSFATGGLREASCIKLQATGIPYTERLLATASEHLSREEIVSAAIHAAALDSTGSLPVSVGDGLWDLLTAHALGVSFLGVGMGAKAQLLADRGATVVRDFLDQRHCLTVLSDLATLGT
ncbi:HAD family hydrolase [Acidisphaera sp. S103]|uniref:HAD family hydrolase n=1 Tax=Acidisphaera sp. S103 TaxID=1747223 RepID=UPI001C204FFE|nr:HAD family hydrolase [Acidisphaera sp. S103]